jgi:hypothetical protein
MFGCRTPAMRNHDLTGAFPLEGRVMAFADKGKAHL